MSNIGMLYEIAARGQFRFMSVRGPRNVEELWEMPLTSKSGFDLDTVAKTVNTELKAMAEESFVATSHNPAKTQTAQRLDLVKHIIATKIAEAEQAKTAAARKEQKQKLLAILAEKQEGKIKEMSIEDLQAQIAALAD